MVQFNTFHLESRPEADWPLRVGVVPPLADCLQSRHSEGEIAMGAGAPTRTYVLHGLGGVGKTQLAASVAERAWDERAVDLLVWVTAASRATIVSGYAQAAAAAGADHGKAGEEAAKHLLSWLAATERRWLIVLDGLADPADLRGLWPPATAVGSTLITTRRTDAALSGAQRRLVPVGLFTSGEARAYLTANLAHIPQSAADMDPLATDLGFLPLALAQATAYMIDRNLTCASYRTRLADRGSAPPSS